MKYVLQKSKEHPGWRVLTDTENQIVCQFKEGDFNGSQKFSTLRDIKDYDVFELPALMRKMADWLVENHPELV